MPRVYDKETIEKKKQEQSKDEKIVTLTSKLADTRGTLCDALKTLIK